MHQPTTFEVDGDAIRKERMQAGMSRAQLARRVQVSERYISHLETGTRRRLRPSTYKRLRAVLDALNETHQPAETDTPEGTTP